MSRGTWQGSGTWQSSGPDLAGLIVPVAVIGAVAAMVMIVVEFALLIAAVAGTMFVLAVALLAYWKLRVEPRHRAIIAEGFAARREAEGRQVEQRQAFTLALAQASAPVIHNHIDPAAILGAIDPAVIAAVLDLKQQPWPQQPQTIRAEVER